MMHVCMHIFCEFTHTNPTHSLLRTHTHTHTHTQQLIRHGITPSAEPNLLPVGMTLNGGGEENIMRMVALEEQLVKVWTEKVSFSSWSCKIIFKVLFLPRTHKPVRKDSSQAQFRNQQALVVTVWLNVWLIGGRWRAGNECISCKY
jgi:hypothetical protein